MKKINVLALLLVLMALPTLWLKAQNSDSLLIQELLPVDISAMRMPTSDLNAPLAVSTLGRARFQDGQLQLTLNEALNGVPGLVLFNAENFAQDTRIAIRGFGARSAFGIRGVKLMVDGFPESTPDGQAQVDNIDLGSLERAEVLRGPAAGLYGNAAGGVISLFTEEPPDSTRLLLRLAGGSFAYRKLQAGLGGRYKKIHYSLSGAYWHTDGYRVLSRAEQTLLNAKIHWRLNKQHRITLLANHANSPYAFDAGALTLSDVNTNRLQAFSRNVQFAAGESVNQQRLGLLWHYNIAPKHALTTRVYGLRRDFVNSLAFESGGIVHLDRMLSGGGLIYALHTKLAGHTYSLQAGFDLDYQSDDRRRRDNLDGRAGNLVFDQNESFGNLGVFLVQHWNPSQRLDLALNLRFDQVWLAARDRFLSDGNDSDKRGYQSFNPMVGLSYAMTERWRAYANVSSSFETPALSELSANPLNSGGFNASLEPQSAWNFELGSKGIFGGRWKWDLALFWIESRKELAPFELDLFPGRTFYRNTGQSQRKGIELGLDVFLGKGWTAGASYTYSDFKYKAYSSPAGSLAGRQLPGLPRHQAHAQVRYLSLRHHWWSSLQARYMGSLFLDDANTLADKAYMLVNLKAGYQYKRPQWSLAPYLGINNLLDTPYNGNVRINAALGRYFEPAAGLHAFGGLVLSW